MNQEILTSHEEVVLSEKTNFVTASDNMRFAKIFGFRGGMVTEGTGDNIIKIVGPEFPTSAVDGADALIASIHSGVARQYVRTLCNIEDGMTQEEVNKRLQPLSSLGVFALCKVQESKFTFATEGDNWDKVKNIDPEWLAKASKARDGRQLYWLTKPNQTLVATQIAADPTELRLRADGQAAIDLQATIDLLEGVSAKAKERDTIDASVTNRTNSRWETAKAKVVINVQVNANSPEITLANM